jgi:GDP-D-mannose 3',5'-epimerase
MKTALVLGAGGFIGNHMVTRLKKEGYWVRGVDLKLPEYSSTDADDFKLGDLRDSNFVREVVTPYSYESEFQEIYQFAADMGGAGFVFTGENDANIMHNSASINLNLLDLAAEMKSEKSNFNPKIFYSSSACVYPEYNQTDPANPNCSEDSAYPANPDSEYGWEKLFSERLYFAYARNYGLRVTVARYHNIFGPLGTWSGGREKAPAAICRKIAMASQTENVVEIWGDGTQTRSFLFIDECIDATRKLMIESNFPGPINIGSEEMVTINQLVAITAKIAKKDVTIKHVAGPIGVMGRNSDNELIREVLGWDYQMELIDGIEKTYQWIQSEIQKSEYASF